MSEIAVDFILGPDWQSRLIARYGTATGYSHCASVLADGRYLDARSDVLDGVPSGVHIRTQQSEKWVKKQRASLEVDLQTYMEWEANLRAKITDDYARGDIVNFILGRPGHHAGQWICSALAINAVQHISRAWNHGHLGFVPFPLPVAVHEISPDAALLILATAGFSIGPVQSIAP
jgi:hypothetical protein